MLVFNLCVRLLFIVDTGTTAWGSADPIGTMASGADALFLFAARVDAALVAGGFVSMTTPTTVAIGMFSSSATSATP